MPFPQALRESKGAEVQKKILSDATRFTYGDAHLEEPLRALKLAPKGQGVLEADTCSRRPTSALNTLHNTVAYSRKGLAYAPCRQGVPVLQSLSESRTPAGGYALSMVFYAPNTPYHVWKDRMAGSDGIARFFGDGKKSLRAWVRLGSVKDRTVELTIATLEEGEEDTALELLNDGSFAPILSIGTSCSRPVNFDPNGGYPVVNAGGDVWVATQRSFPHPNDGQPSLWYALPLPPRRRRGMALNLSACNEQLSTTEVFLWQGECKKLAQLAYAAGDPTACRTALSIPPDDLARGQLYVEVRGSVEPGQREFAMAKQQVVRASWALTADAPPSGLYWTCCGGEGWVTLPLFGTMHVPASLHAVQDSFVLPVTVTVLIGCWMFSAILAWLLHSCCESRLRHRPPTSYQNARRQARRHHRTLQALAPVMGYLVAAVCIGGEPGRTLLALLKPDDNLVERGVLQPSQMQASAPVLEGWRARPLESPLANMSEGTPFRVALFSEAFAAGVAQRVGALRHTHWT